MKKILKISIVAAILMSFGLDTNAQTSRLGISINSLTTNFNYGSSNEAMQPYKKNFRGLQVGLSYQAAVSSSFSIVPELYFAVKGGTLTNQNPLTTNKSTLRLQTLDLPVLARVHFGQFYLNAGPYVGYTLAARLKMEKTTNSGETKTPVMIGANGLKRWDYGFQAGAGYDFNLRRSTLALDVRYGYGIANLSSDIARYNRMLNISLTVRR